MRKLMCLIIYASLLVILASCGAVATAGDVLNHTSYESENSEDNINENVRDDETASYENTEEAPSPEPLQPEEIVVPQFSAYIYMPEDLYFFSPENLPVTTGTGYTWLIPPILNPTEFTNGRAVMWSLEPDELGQFIGDISGRVIAVPKRGNIMYHFGDTVLISYHSHLSARDSHWSTVDLQSQEVTSIGRFDTFWPMPELGLASVSRGVWPNEQASIINFMGQEVVPLQFWRSNMSYVYDGLVAVSINDPEWHHISERWGFVDVNTGEVAILPEYGWVLPFSEGLAAVVVGPLYWGYNYRWGFINPQGEMVVSAIYTGAMSFSEGMAGVMTGRDEVSQRWGFVDRMGTEIVPPIYYEVLPFSEGLAAVRMGNWPDTPKWGFVDLTGREVIPIIYEDVRSFSGGLAAVQIDGKWGFIDPSGNMVIPPDFTMAWPFENGLAMTYVGYSVWINPCDGGPTPFGGEWCVIDTYGNVMATLPYAFVYMVEDGMAMVRVGSDEMFFCDTRDVYLPADAGRWGGAWGLVRLDDIR